MKTRIIALILAALMLTASLAVPSLADEAQLGSLEYEKLVRNAKFTASFFWGDGADEVRSNFFSTAVQMYPENVTYHGSMYSFFSFMVGSSIASSPPSICGTSSFSTFTGVRVMCLSKASGLRLTKV